METCIIFGSRKCNTFMWAKIPNNTKEYRPWPSSIFPRDNLCYKFLKYLSGCISHTCTHTQTLFKQKVLLYYSMLLPLNFVNLTIELGALSMLAHKTYSILLYICKLFHSLYVCILFNHPAIDGCRVCFLCVLLL